MKSRRLWRHLAIGVIAAGPVGGFIWGLLNAGDPDPNPIGRTCHALMMAVLTPLHAGFPPHGEAVAGRSYNAWPHIVFSGLAIVGWLVYRDWKLSGRRHEPTS